MVVLECFCYSKFSRYSKGLWLSVWRFWKLESLSIECHSGLLRRFWFVANGSKSGFVGKIPMLVLLSVEVFDVDVSWRFSWLDPFWMGCHSDLLGSRCTKGSESSDLLGSRCTKGSESGFIRWFLKLLFWLVGDGVVGNEGCNWSRDLLWRPAKLWSLGARFIQYGSRLTWS